ncbi:hypothetical protein LTR53_009096 [Teratosphaeriaceae sp. CCFEE 6253]|nr:hypothetical protein LTR53_009096 [Teratosphaeriaceae sp. CCFEE 6253]
MAGRKNKSESRPPFRLQHSSPAQQLPRPSPAQQTPAHTEQPGLKRRAKKMNLNVRERELDARQAELDVREAELDAQREESGERLATADAGTPGIRESGPMQTAHSDVRESQSVSGGNDAIAAASDEAGIDTGPGQTRHEGVDEHTARDGDADICGNEAVLLTAEDFEEGGELVAVPSDEEYMTPVGNVGSAPNGEKAKKSRWMGFG